MAGKEEMVILDEGVGSLAFAELSAHSEVFLGTSLVLVYRLGFSQRLLYKHLLPVILSKASVVLLGSQSPVLLGKVPLLVGEDTTLERSKVYHFGKASWKEKMALLERRIEGWRAQGNQITVLFLLETLRKWNDELDTAVRLVLENAPYLNLNLWLHSSLDLIPDDLLPTIGNVLILWPSPEEVRYLKAKLPTREVDLGREIHPSGAFVHLHFSGEWKYRKVRIKV